MEEATHAVDDRKPKSPKQEAHLKRIMDQIKADPEFEGVDWEEPRNKAWLYNQSIRRWRRELE